MNALASTRQPPPMAPWVQPRHGPPAWNNRLHAWMITRHAEVGAVLRASAFRVFDVGEIVALLSDKTGRDFDALHNILGGILFYRNPPFHPEARRFAKRCMALMRDSLSPPRVQAAVEQVVSEALRRGQVDAFEAIGLRIPLLVMSRALGISYGAGDLMLRSAEISLIGDRGVRLREFAELQEQAAEVERVVGAEFRQAIAGGEGNLAAIAALNEAEFGFSEREVLAIICFLIFAGVETSSAFLSSTLYLLLANPAELDKLLASPDLTDRALDEILRYAAPVGRANGRIAPEGLELGGRRFEGGELLICEIEQAHHDPAAFDEPDRFLIERTGPPTYPFSAGVHTCLGAPLARLEAQLLLRELFGVARATLVDATPQWQEHPVFRRLERLDIVLEPIH